jgi:HD-GYP domain-containing protein (c-di-GMP phosphodiesterase class II)
LPGRARLVGKSLGFEEEQIQELNLSEFLHDIGIGKIKVSDEILHKPCHLNEQKLSIQRDHVCYEMKVLVEMGISDSIVKTTR